MVVTGHIIHKRLRIKDFVDIIKYYSTEQIKCTDHTFFRLSEKQRKEFLNCEKLKIYITEKIPIFVGIQNNGCYAIYYSFNKMNALKMILDVKPNNISIITFYIINKVTIPKMKYEK